MIVDPRGRRARPPLRLRGGRAPLVVCVALAAEVADLRDLAEWEPVGSLLDEIPLAARGEGSLSQREVSRLRTWVANWRALAPDLRRFYSANCNEDDAQSALWFVLGARLSRPPSWPVARLYREATGYEAPFDLLPLPATQEHQDDR